MVGPRLGVIFGDSDNSVNVPFALIYHIIIDGTKHRLPLRIALHALTRLSKMSPPRYDTIPNRSPKPIPNPNPNRNLNPKTMDHVTLDRKEANNTWISFVNKPPASVNLDLFGGPA